MTCGSKLHAYTCSLRLQIQTALLYSTSSVAIFGDKNYKEPDNSKLKDQFLWKVRRFGKTRVRSKINKEQNILVI